MDRAAYLREILREGFDDDMQECFFEKCLKGELSQMEICETLRLDSWQFVSLLKTRGLYLNVELEDLLDSLELPGKT